MIDSSVLDPDFLGRIDRQPRPTAAELGQRGLGEFFLELREAAELGVDCLGEFARGPRAVVLLERFPEKVVVVVAAGVVANGAG